MKTGRGRPLVLYARAGSPLGALLLVGEVAPLPEDGLVLRGIYFEAAPHARGAVPGGAREDLEAFAPALRQIEEYFEGERTTFDLALAPRGSTFQRRVWRRLDLIPHGTTTTYAAIARSLGMPAAARAVGAANARNPLSIVVPCHRVIGRDGALTGYAGGVAAKRVLLELEARVAAASKPRLRSCHFASVAERTSRGHHRSRRRVPPLDP